MTLSLLLLIAGVAAGVPVALPPGEVPERWLDPLALHALEVGEVLKRGLTDVAARHPIVSDVRGEGLFVGVELTEHPGESAAARQASYVQERLRDHGILTGIDGPRHNVLKIKPPMVFSLEDADRVVSALDSVLVDTCLNF